MDNYSVMYEKLPNLVFMDVIKKLMRKYCIGMKN